MQANERLRLFRALAFVGASFVLLVNASFAQGVSPSAVIDGFEHDAAQPDVDAAVARFSDTAQVTVYGQRNRILNGHEQIREFLEGSRGMPTPVLTSARHIDGNLVSWSERVPATDVSPARDRTVRATVYDGKIQSLTYRPGSSQLDGPAAATVTPASAGLALCGLLLLGVGLLTLATVRQRVRSGSMLSGKLLSGLSGYVPARNSPTASANSDGRST